MKKLRRRLLYVALPLILIVALLFAIWPPAMTVTPTGTLSISAGTALASPDAGKPAYQICIPNGEGSETGLQVFPPKLQIGGKDNWLAVQSPQGLDEIGRAHV